MNAKVLVAFGFAVEALYSTICVIRNLSKVFYVQLIAFKCVQIVLRIKSNIYCRESHFKYFLFLFITRKQSEEFLKIIKELFKHRIHFIKNFTLIEFDFELYVEDFCLPAALSTFAHVSLPLSPCMHM